MLGLIGALLTGGFSLAKEWFAGKAEEKRISLKNAQIELEAEGVVKKAAAEAKAKAMTTRMEGDIAWENIWATGAQSSWKDEWWTIILATPYVLNLVPAVVGTFSDPTHAQTVINLAFKAMDTIPEYWNWMTGLSVGASFGIRKATDFFALKKGI